MNEVRLAGGWHVSRARVACQPPALQQNMSELVCKRELGSAEPGERL
ncbi:hypothetical protein ACQU0X_32070 [Pseudovibrio ascidiaceicola]